jgi:hypothetical protein
MLDDFKVAHPREAHALPKTGGHFWETLLSIAAALADAARKRPSATPRGNKPRSEDLLEKCAHFCCG